MKSKKIMIIFLFIAALFLTSCEFEYDGITYVCDDDGEVMPWKGYVTPISYCPMCGRKLDGGK